MLRSCLHYLNSEADPGFPKGGGANPRGGTPTYYLTNFSRKLHENKEILAQKGSLLDPPLGNAKQKEGFITISSTF